MPQTSPINWMVTSLVMILMVTTMSTNDLMKKPKNHFLKKNTNKKIFKWLW